MECTRSGLSFRKWQTTKKRAVPSKWTSRFSCIYQKLDVKKNDDDDDDDDDDEDDDEDDDDGYYVVCLGEVQPPSSDIVCIDDPEPHELSAFTSSVLDDAHPELQALLNGSSDESMQYIQKPKVKRRLISKTTALATTTQKTPEKTLAGFDLKALESLGTPSGGTVVNPAAFRGMNAGLKKERLQNKTPMKAMKAMKSEKAMKTMKAMKAMKAIKVTKKKTTKDIIEKISLQTYFKREHSKVWHRERKKVMRSGKDKFVAGAAASVKAGTYMEKLREDVRVQGPPKHVAEDVD